MSRSATDDWALLFAWRDGDTTAGNTLATRYFDLLLRFFITKVRDMDDATELVSETFLACTANLDRVSETGAFRSYLLAVAMNKLRGYYRKQVKRQREIDDFADICVDTALRHSPSAIVALEQEIQLLVRGLRRLSLVQQIVIELQMVEGLSLSEVSEISGVPRPTVATHLRRGKQRLVTIIRELSAQPKLAESTVAGLETWAGRIRASIDSQKKSERA